MVTKKFAAISLSAILLMSLGIYVAWFLGIGTPGRENLPRPFSSKEWKSAE
jgi:hypothetical protein